MLNLVHWSAWLVRWKYGWIVESNSIWMVLVNSVLILKLLVLWVKNTGEAVLKETPEPGRISLRMLLIPRSSKVLAPRGDQSKVA